MRTAYAAVTLVAVALLAGLSRGDNPEPDASHKAAQKAIIELAENLDGTDVPERAAKVVRDHASEDISSVFMNRYRGGMGVGSLHPAGAAPQYDSVERLVRNWTNRPPTAADIETNQVQMLKITRVIRAMSELAPYRVPKNAKPERKKEWAEVAAEFHETAAGLHLAVENADPKAIREAARKLNGTCCHCHGLLD
jgi:hypothetical protein